MADINIFNFLKKIVWNFQWRVRLDWSQYYIWILKLKYVWKNMLKALNKSLNEGEKKVNTQEQRLKQLLNYIDHYA